MRAAVRVPVYWIPATLLLALHIGYLSFGPEDPDVGGIAYNAMVLRRGGVPYRDTFEQKLPGAFFLMAGIFSLLGERVVALNAAAALWSLAHLWGIQWGVRRLWGSAAGWWAALAYAVASTAPVISGRCPNYELWMTMPTTWAVLLVMGNAPSSRVHLALVGFLAAAGVMVKQQATFSCLPLVVWLASYAPRRVKALVWMAVGAFGVVLPVVGFFALEGYLGGWLGMVHPKGALVYASGGAQPGDPVWLIARRETMRVFQEMPLLFAAGTVALACLLTSRPVSTPVVLLGSWIVGAAVGVSSGMRFYRHYYVQLVPPMAVAVGFLAAQLDPRVKGLRGQAAAWLLAALLAWPSLGRVIHDLRMAWFQTKYAALRLPMPKPPPMRVASLIRDLVPEDGRILVWGHAEDLYFLSGRMAPTRYYKYFAFMSPPPLTWGPPTLNPLAREHANRFLREIRRTPPAAIVVATGRSDAPPGELPEFHTFLGEYRLVATEGSLQVWVRHPP